MCGKKSVTVKYYYWNKNKMLVPDGFFSLHYKIYLFIQFVFISLLRNMERTDQSFNIVDIKPENMEELTEVITASCFHPKHCNLFMYSSSRGCIKLGDMRQRALCDEHSKMFEITEETADRSFFSEIIASVSDVKFAGDDGRYILSRYYLTLKVRINFLAK
jgi:hypothetical protein